MIGGIKLIAYISGEFKQVRKMEYLECIEHPRTYACFTVGEFYKNMCTDGSLIRVKTDSGHNFIIPPNFLYCFKEVSENEYISRLKEIALKKFPEIGPKDSFCGIYSKIYQNRDIADIHKWAYYSNIDALYTQPKGEGGFCVYRCKQWAHIIKNARANKLKLKLDFRDQVENDNYHKIRFFSLKDLDKTQQNELILKIEELMLQYGFVDEIRL